MQFTRVERRAIALLLSKLEGGELNSTDGLLAELSAMVDADHAELSRWRFWPSGERGLGDREVFDPMNLGVPLWVLPGDESPVDAPMREGHRIGTWTVDVAPDRGGPALLSTRHVDGDQVLLLAFRRTPNNPGFTPRHAAMIDALNRCHSLWEAVTRFTSPKSGGTI